MVVDFFPPERSCDPGRFGKAHINGKELVGGGFCSTKKLSQKLVVLAKLFSLLVINFLLKLFQGSGKGVKVIVSGQKRHFLHIELKILDIHDQVWLHHCVDHLQESGTLVSNIASLGALISKQCLANE